MIEIDALLTTGVPALADLHGSSPSGGMVTSESRPGRLLLPGDVIRHDGNGEWVVVADVRHNGKELEEPVSTLLQLLGFGANR